LRKGGLDDRHTRGKKVKPQIRWRKKRPCRSIMRPGGGTLWRNGRRKAHSHFRFPHRKRKGFFPVPRERSRWRSAPGGRGKKRSSGGKKSKKKVFSFPSFGRGRGSTPSGLKKGGKVFDISPQIYQEGKNAGRGGDIKRGEAFLLPIFSREG